MIILTIILEHTTLKDVLVTQKAEQVQAEVGDKDINFFK